jgi:hypothetical protein
MPLLKNEIRMFCPFCENVINININAINIVVNEKKYFSIDERLEDDLNKGIISERLKTEFKTKGIPLSNDAIIIKDREDQWEITDKKIYIAKKEDDTLNVYDVNITAICPTKCKEKIHLRRAKAKCPCGHDNNVLIPEGTQILETHYLDTYCKKCGREKRKDKKKQLGNIYWTKCDERPKEATYFHFSEIETKCDKCEGKFHIRIIKGEKSTCLLTGGEECTGINQSILGGMTNRFGNWVQKRYLSAQKKFFGGCTSFSPYRIEKFGELAFCIIIGMSLGVLYPWAIFLIFGRVDLISVPFGIFLDVFLVVVCISRSLS